MKLSLPTLIISLSFIAQIHANVIYVKTNMFGAGTSWMDAVGSLQEALLAAEYGDEIRVAQGVYYPVDCSSCTDAHRRISFVIPDGVKLVGGFSGNESLPEERNSEVFKTVLSGDIDRDSSLENNSYTIVFFKNVSTITMLDGFVISGGNATGNGVLGARENSGAAIFNEGQLRGNSSTPLIKNCHFENNFSRGYGGAVYNDGSFSGEVNIHFIKCHFKNNHAIEGGGAVFNNGSFDGQCSPVFEDCIFANNETQASAGGAIFNSGAENGIADGTWIKCRFESNTAASYGGAVLNFGKTGHCNPLFTACKFYGNKAAEGGAIYNDGSFGGACNPLIVRGDFQENEAWVDGGAIYNSASESGSCNAVFKHCRFVRQRCGIAGAAVFNNGYSGSCQPEFWHCAFLKNQTPNYGAAMYNLGNAGICSPAILNCLFAYNQAYSAGAIYNLGAEHGDSSPNIINATFFANEATVGGAIYCNASDTTGRSSPFISNSIFYKNKAPTGAVFRIIYGSPQVRFSLFDIENCNILNDGNGGTVLCGDGVIFNEKPQFQDTAHANFYLLPNSPAIDVGDNTATFDAAIKEDFLMHPRIAGTRVDLGIFESDTLARDTIKILKMPEPQLICAGEKMKLTVEAVSGKPVFYRWYRDGVPVPGGRDSVLTVAEVDTTDRGAYHCLISNETGCYSSDTVFVAVQKKMDTGVTITTADSILCLGAEASFEASYLYDYEYGTIEWWRDGTFSGVTGQNFQLADIQSNARVQAKLISALSCPASEIIWSETIAIRVDSCFNFTKNYIKNNNYVHLAYPNPTDGPLNVLLDFECRLKKIFIYNQEGRLIFERPVAGNRKQTRHALSIGMLKKGVYWLNIQLENGVLLKERIIVVNN